MPISFLFLTRRSQKSSSSTAFESRD
jgi:hypothetical protein